MNDINTYGDLKRAVQVWLNRKDSSTLDNIPMFVNFALKQFARLVSLPYYETLVNLDVVPGKDFVNIPDNFLSAKHVMVNNKPYNRVDVETFTRLDFEYSTTLPSNGDIPEIGFFQGATSTRDHFFTRVGDRLIFRPALVDGDKVQLIYRRDIPELRDDKDAPYFLLTASDVMLYLSLRHAAIFLRDNAQEAYWNEKAQEAAMTLQKQLDEAEWSGSAYVVPMFRE